MSNKKKFLVFCYTGLGNLILKIPLFANIKNLYPDAEIDIITGNRNNFQTDEDFFLKQQNLISNIIKITEDDNLLNAYKKLIKINKKKYNAIFLPFDGTPLRFKILMYFIRGKKIMHYIILPKKIFSSYFKFLFFYLCLDMKLVKLKLDKHEVSSNLDLFKKYINANNLALKEFVPLNKDKIEHTNVLNEFKLIKYKYIVIQPTAADGILKAKVWSPDNFRALIEKLASHKPEYKIVLVGNSSDSQTLKNIFLTESKSYVNTLGKLDLNQLIDLIKYSKLVISHDSSIMHISSVLNKQQIALYGPTDIVRTGPVGKNASILLSKTKYLHAMKNFEYSEYQLSKLSENYELMSNISVNQVYDTLDKLLNKDKNLNNYT